MNKKKVVALLAAATMLLGTVPVFAGQESTTSGTNIIVTGDATVNDVDKSAKFKVTLPTNNALNFIVDPHNLVGLTSGQASDLDLTATGAGAILAADDALAVIENRSNVDVKVDVKLSVQSNQSGLKLVTDQGAVTTGTEQAMFIGIVPSTQKAYDASTYTTTNQAIAIEATGSATTDVAFKLDAADYEVVKQADGSFKYQYKVEDDNFDATAFKIGGKVNKQADWTAYKDDLGVKAVFNFVEADSTVELASGSAIYGLVSGSATTTQFDSVVAATVTETAQLAFDSANQRFWMSDEDGNAFDSTDNISSVKINGKDCTATYRVTNGYITIDWNTAADASNGATWTMEVVMDGVVYIGQMNAS